MDFWWTNSQCACTPVRESQKQQFANECGRIIEVVQKGGKSHENRFINVHKISHEAFSNYILMQFGLYSV